MRTMKTVITASAVLVLLAIIGWQQYKISRMKEEHRADTQRIKQMEDEETAYWLKQLQRIPSDHLKRTCAQHIGQLKGGRHDAALLWFQPFYDDNRSMTEDDFEKCKQL